MSTIHQENFKYLLNRSNYFLKSYIGSNNLILFFSSIGLQIFDFTAEDLEDMGEIGRGNFGSKYMDINYKKTMNSCLFSIIGVNKMLHIKTSTVMAVKVK